MRPYAAAILAAALAVALSACTSRPEHPPAPIAGGEVRIALDEIEGRGPVFYALVHDGKKIGFFVVQAPGGIESYFDACAKCYPKKLGYRAAEGKLQCRACGLWYEMDDLGGVGSCHPLPIKGRVDGNSYVIEKETLIRGAGYF